MGMFSDKSKIKNLWLIVGVCFIVFLSVFLWWQSREKGPEIVIMKHLEALHNNKISEAYYAFTAHDFQTSFPLSDFREFLKTYDLTTHYENMRISPVEFKENEAFVSTMLTGPDKDFVIVKYTLVNEGNAWKILKVWVNNTNSKSTTPSSGLAEWLIPIETQLSALRSKNIEKAYNLDTSKVFKNASSIDDFKKFVKYNPILSSHNNYILQKQSFDGDEITVEIVLNPDKNKDAVSFTYTLEKEDGQWKILNMGETAKFEIVNAMRAPIEKQLAALKDQNIFQAYKDHTSKAFRGEVSLEVFKKLLAQYPIFMKYQRTEFKEPRLENETWLMMVELIGKDGNVFTAEYALGLEDDQWEIWGIRGWPGKRP